MLKIVPGDRSAVRMPMRFLINAVYQEMVLAIYVIKTFVPHEVRINMA